MLVAGMLPVCPYHLTGLNFVWQVLIQDGELLTGTLCKKTLGAANGTLIHVIWNEEGPEAARAFLSQMQYLVNHWLLNHGFSIGIGDTVADTKTMQNITDTIAAVSRWNLVQHSMRTRLIVPANIFVQWVKLVF